MQRKPAAEFQYLNINHYQQMSNETEHFCASLLGAQ